MSQLDGKVALVTGGARGMGAETVRLFAAEGARVVIADRLAEEGRALAQEIGAAVRFQRLDVSEEADWQRAVSETEAAFGPIDVLVNNAAIQRFRSILETSVADLRSVLDVNLVGTFLGLRIVGGAMVRRRTGSIINISSIDGMRGANGYAAYSTSKWAVRGLTKVAAQEFGPRNVRVNSVHPGSVNTKMGNPVGRPAEELNAHFTLVPMQRMGETNEIAQASLFLASDRSSYVNGAELAVDGGWSAGVYTASLPGSPEDAAYGSEDIQHAGSALMDQAIRSHY